MSMKDGGRGFQKNLALALAVKGVKQNSLIEGSEIGRWQPIGVL